MQDAQREAAEAEKKEHDAETLAEGLMQQLLQEALTEMCDARACYDTRLELRAVRFAPQPIQLRAKTTADASDASEPESPRSPRASATSLKNLPPLKTPKHGIDEPMSPSGSSPPTSPFERGLQSQRSVGSVTASEIDSEGDEAAVRSDRKYVGRYVADVMRSFLTNQVALLETIGLQLDTLACQSGTK